MKITETRVKRVMKDGNLKGVASITIEGVFVVHDLKILEGENGMFIGMPSKKFIDATGRDTHKDIAHALNTDTRKYIQETVLAAYQEELKKA